MHSGHVSGHCMCSTHSRGKPKGKSKPPTHRLPDGAGAFKKFRKASSVTNFSKRSSLTRPRCMLPNATTMGLRWLGLLEKSQPIKQTSSTPNDGGCGHEFFEQCQRDRTRNAVRIKLSALGVFQQDAGVDTRDIDLPHGPTTETTL